MNAMVTWSMRRAPTILFVLSLVVLVIGLIVAFMSASFTAQQAANIPFGAIAPRADGIARIQLLSGISTALQNAIWPFAAAALVCAVQWRPAPEGLHGAIDA